MNEWMNALSKVSCWDRETYNILLLCLYWSFFLCCRVDRTSTGHVLGDPLSRPKVCAPERNLSPVVVSVLRLLMHSAMVLGTTRRPQVCWCQIKTNRVWPARVIFTLNIVICAKPRHFSDNQWRRQTILTWCGFSRPINPFTPKCDQPWFSLSVSHQRYIIQYGELGIW